jgi:hypothetical protein
MLKKILFIPILILLAACEVTDSDTYFFEPESVAIDPQPQIIIKRYPSSRAVRAAYAKSKHGRKLEDKEELFGFSEITSKTCVVHVVDPAVNYEPAELGHEVTHCLYGNFHPRQDEVRVY